MIEADPVPPPAKGVAVIEAALATMPANRGVYRMLDAKGEALYVGKARNLARRVTAYTRPVRLDERRRRMENETVAMTVITTHTEAGALLLEATLIERISR
jgi:excinuclease ABC subunit C